jgi:WXXGXW repeat (2 copies)
MDKVSSLILCAATATLVLGGGCAERHGVERPAPVALTSTQDTVLETSPQSHLPWEETSNTAVTAAPPESPPADAGTAPITATEAPPQSPVEVVGQPPNPGYVWIPGVWEWRGYWFWAPGHWAKRPRPSVSWVRGQWEQRSNGWVWTKGYWR